MKITCKILPVLIIGLGLSAGCAAQSTAFASTTAVLVTPISISKTTDMHFGTVASSGTAGTVVLDQSNGRTTTGGASLPTGGISPTSAVFAVTGQGTSGFSITIPSAPITLSNGVQTMTVSNFVCDAGAATTLVAGSKTLNIGATLNVGANQAAGTYTKSGDLAGLFVTVNYN